MKDVKTLNEHIQSGMVELQAYHPQAIDNVLLVAKLVGSGQLPSGALLGIWVRSCKNAGFSDSEMRQLFRQALSTTNEITLAEKAAEDSAGSERSSS